MKAVALLSGGLDSMLAVCLVRRQGIEPLGLSLVSVFHSNDGSGEEELSAVKAARRLGIDLELLPASESMLEVVRHPRYGYGSGVNPCIDCRISMLKSAREYMAKTGARFIVTGEVLGQRPMSQRVDAMKLIDKQTRLEGLIVRPLSAKALPPTVPELEGWVDREGFLDITGRSRKVQMRLADELGVTDYPTPAGGCLLTDPAFTRKMRDLLDHGDVTIEDVRSLRVGRHFRLDDRTKVAVGRNQADNDKITALAGAGDVLLESMNVPGPTALLRGNASHENVLTAAKLVARYSKTRGASETVVKISGSDRAPEKVVIDRVGEGDLEGLHTI